MLLTVDADRDGGRTVLHIGGRLDLPSAAELRSAIDLELEQEPSRLVIDLSAVDFLDSTGLGVLVAAQRRAAGLGTGIVLCGARPIVDRVLRLTGAVEILPVYADADEALAAG